MLWLNHSMTNKRTIILGGGVTGLATGWKLAESGWNVEVLEKRDHVGGTAASFTHSGTSGDYKVDLGPHKIYTQLSGILEEIKALLGDELQALPKKSRIRILGKYFNYPFKPVALLTSVPPLQAMGFGLSYAKAATFRTFGHPEDYSYEKYLTNRFGKQIYEAVFKGYAEKVWGVDPNGLDAELARIRVSIPSLSELVKRMFLGEKNKKEITAHAFYYPKKGCIRLSEKMAERILQNKGSVHLKAWPTELKLEGRRVTEVTYEKNGLRKSTSPDFVVSSIHLGQVVKLLRPVPPENVLQAAARLRYRGLIVLYLVVNKPRLFEDNWIFYPEKEVVFNRLSEQKGFSSEMGPADKTVLMVEITCSPSTEVGGGSLEMVQKEKGDWAWNATDSELFERAVADLEKVGILKKEDVAEYFAVRLRNKYPVYDIGFDKNLNEVAAYLESLENFLTIGRQGLFNYNNMDHCMDMGFLAAKHVVEEKTRQDWQETKKKFQTYQIVD